MSGEASGVGETIISSVRSLPLEGWPEADRLGWAAACKLGQRLTRGGTASHLASVTKEDLARRYGYFLDFLDRSGHLDRGAEAGTQVTPEAVANFIAELQARVSSITVSRTIYKVRRAAECIAPERDFAWLAELERDLMLLERPKNNFDRIVLTERLVEGGLTLIAEAENRGPWLRRALLVRNGLMVALLAACPIRLKNFAALEIGCSFLKSEGGWWIALEDTKSKRPDHRPVPSFLAGSIESYLETYRPVLLRQATARDEPRPDLKHGPAPSTITSPQNEPARPLWLSRRGKPLGYSQVERAITETTRTTVGVPVNPHLFRTAGATSAALHASHSPHLASALLQHSDPKVTEQYYNRASSLSVARDFAKLIREL